MTRRIDRGKVSSHICHCGFSFVFALFVLPASAPGRLFSPAALGFAGLPSYFVRSLRPLRRGPAAAFPVHLLPAVHGVLRAPCAVPVLRSGGRHLTSWNVAIRSTACQVITQGVAKRCWAAAGIRMRVLWYAVLCCAAAQQLGALGLRLFHRPLLPADFWLLFGVVSLLCRAGGL